MWQRWEANVSGWELCPMKGFVLVLHLQILVPQESVTFYAWHSLVTGELLTAYAQGSLCGISREQAVLRHVFLYTPKFSLAIYHSTNASYFWYSRVQYHGTEYHHIATAGKGGCIFKGLSFTALLQQIQWAAVPGDSVSLHCCSWYSRLQYHRTSVSALLQLVQYATVLRDSVSWHCYCWYSSLEHQGLSLCALPQQIQQVAVPGD